MTEAKPAKAYRADQPRVPETTFLVTKIDPEAAQPLWATRRSANSEFASDPMMAWLEYLSGERPTLAVWPDLVSVDDSRSILVASWMAWPKELLQAEHYGLPYLGEHSDTAPYHRVYLPTTNPQKTLNELEEICDRAKLDPCLFDDAQIQDEKWVTFDHHRYLFLEQQKVEQPVTHAYWDDHTPAMQRFLDSVSVVSGFWKTADSPRLLVSIASGGVQPFGEFLPAEQLALLYSSMSAHNQSVADHRLTEDTVVVLASSDKEYDLIVEHTATNLGQRISAVKRHDMGLPQVEVDNATDTYEWLGQSPEQLEILEKPLLPIYNIESPRRYEGNGSMIWARLLPTLPEMNSRKPIAGRVTLRRENGKVVSAAAVLVTRYESYPMVRGLTSKPKIVKEKFGDVYIAKLTLGDGRIDESQLSAVVPGFKGGSKTEGSEILTQRLSTLLEDREVSVKPFETAVTSGFRVTTKNEPAPLEHPEVAYEIPPRPAASCVDALRLSLMWKLGYIAMFERVRPPPYKGERRYNERVNAPTDHYKLLEMPKKNDFGSVAGEVEFAQKTCADPMMSTMREVWLGAEERLAFEGDDLMRPPLVVPQESYLPSLTYGGSCVDAKWLETRACVGDAKCLAEKLGEACYECAQAHATCAGDACEQKLIECLGDEPGRVEINGKVLAYHLSKREPHAGIQIGPAIRHVKGVDASGEVAFGTNLERKFRVVSYTGATLLELDILPDAVGERCSWNGAPGSSMARGVCKTQEIGFDALTGFVKSIGPLSPDPKKLSGWIDDDRFLHVDRSGDHKVWFMSSLAQGRSVVMRRGLDRPIVVPGHGWFSVKGSPNHPEELLRVDLPDEKPKVFNVGSLVFGPNRQMIGDTRGPVFFNKPRETRPIHEAAIGRIAYFNGEILIYAHDGISRFDPKTAKHEMLFDAAAQGLLIDEAQAIRGRYFIRTFKWGDPAFEEFEYKDKKFVSIAKGHNSRDLARHTRTKNEKAKPLKNLFGQGLKERGRGGKARNPDAEFCSTDSCHRREGKNIIYSHPTNKKWTMTIPNRRIANPIAIGPNGRFLFLKRPSVVLDLKEGKTRKLELPAHFKSSWYAHFAVTEQGLLIAVADDRLSTFPFVGE